MADRAQSWGVLPRYFGYKGDVVETTPETAEAILAAMGADRDRPRRGRRRPIPPGHCAPAPARAWGWAVQLYAARSRDSWGIGDLADLRRLGRWASTEGASVLLINPLGAQPPIRPQQDCPYYASSRRFLNSNYLRVDEVDGAEQCAPELEPLRNAARSLNGRRLIDHDEVFRLKQAALEHIFKAAPTPEGMAGWVRQQGRALREFSAFNALTEVHGPAWRSWPSDLRHPEAPGIDSVRVELKTRIAFHEWLQFHLDRQLARAAREIGLITDVPVGFASDGFDAWRWQDLLAQNTRVGAPPDYFFQDGQDWGMPPFDPWKLRAAGYAPFLEALNSVGRHAAGLRLDHVMGLFRLYWIPMAGPGAYVRYPGAEMLALLAEASRKTNTFVVGEDLGIVEPSTRRKLRARGVLSYRLLWFEERPPAAYLPGSMAALTTHDLPTLAGIWEGSDPDGSVRERLRRHAGAVDGRPTCEVAEAAHRALASSPSKLLAATLEDALCIAERPNKPGTTSEWPNWSLALPLSLEQVCEDPRPGRLAAVLRR